MATSKTKVRGFRLGLSKRAVGKKGGVFKFGEWPAVRRGFKGRARFSKAISEESQVFGEKHARKLVRRIRAVIRGGRAEGDPLSVATVQNLKSGNTKDVPWHETGRLAEAVNVWKVGKFTWAIGFREKQGASHGRMDVAAIAMQLEFGAKIPVTDAMRGYLRSQGIFIKNNTRFIIIPPRPVVRPAIELQQKEVADDFFGKVGTKIINRVFGTPRRTRPRLR